ncbi:MAG: hypothetical protein AB1762_06705, partial [Gemmatimonadota bacterium]
TIKHARQSHDPYETSRLWGSYLWLHNAAAWLLTVVVPFLNLAILGASLTILLSRIPAGLQALILGFLVVVALVGFRTFRRLQQKPRTEKAMGPSLRVLAIASGLAIALYVYLTRQGNSALTLRLLLLAWVALQAALIALLGRVYDDRVRRAKQVGLTISVATAGALIWFTIRAHDVVDLAFGALRTIELTFLVLSAAWILVTLGGILSAGAAALVLWKGGPARSRARRAMWTGATTLAVTTASVSALAIGAWAALHAVLAASLPAPKPPQMSAPPAAQSNAVSAPSDSGVTPDTSYAYRSLVRHVLLRRYADNACFGEMGTAGAPGQSESRVVTCRDFSLKSIVRTLLSVSAMSGLLVNGFALLLTTIMGLWLTFPSIVKELRPTGDPDKTNADRSIASGVWLTQGFTQLRRVAMGVYALVFGGTGLVIALALWIFVNGAASDGWPVAVFEVLQPASDTFLFGLGSAVAASTVGVLALLSRFGRFANMIRPVLDVALDVDNYLKSRPEKRTPRARMMERYAALLRYITRWRRGGVGYDAIIIVAHSQGTVLTSDLLRYQQARGFEHLSLTGGYTWQRTPGVAEHAPLHIDLFTMGSPLRQLYTRSFPDLYRWTALPHGQPAESARSFCSSLGVRRWWNVFRSGDYVGRALWQYRGQHTAYVPKQWRQKGDSCREQCLGVGAHTHYWDENGLDDVAVILDELIAAAYAESPRASSSERTAHSS